jgi:LAO/AO transport system kinase
LRCVAERSTDPEALFAAACDGDRRALGRLISLVERGGRPAHAVGHLSFHASGSAYTVGVTGSPGVGKSTLTNALIGEMGDQGEQVAVLAIDPTSPFSGGAILGDRVRMQDYATTKGVFIRSMATRGHLGGLSLATPEAVRLLDAVGWKWILIETVGVGQVEIEIAATADTTVVVVNPGWGDSVQANKAGLMEIGDVFVINKADRPGVDQTHHDLEAMLDMSAAASNGWRPPIVTTVASERRGVAELRRAIHGHRQFLTASGTMAVKRAARVRHEVTSIVTKRLEAMTAVACSGERWKHLADEVEKRRIDPWVAAEQLLATLVR